MCKGQRVFGNTVTTYQVPGDAAFKLKTHMW
jgi:hypothetical protein